MSRAMIPRPLSLRRVIVQATSRIGIPNTSSVVPILACPRTASVPIKNPSNCDPESPRISRALYALKGRNPEIAPISARPNRTSSPLPNWAESIAIMDAATSTTPGANPSRPSSKLTAFIIPTSQKTVSAPPASGGSSITPPNGLLIPAICTPSPTADKCHGYLADQFYPRPQLTDIIGQSDCSYCRRAKSAIPTNCPGSAAVANSAIENAGKTTRPPKRTTGLRCIRPGPGRSSAPM